jgi:hypothetical protein
MDHITCEAYLDFCDQLESHIFQCIIKPVLFLEQ